MHPAHRARVDSSRRSADDRREHGDARVRRRHGVASTIRAGAFHPCRRRYSVKHATTSTHTVPVVPEMTVTSTSLRPQTRHVPCVMVGRLLVRISLELAGSILPSVP
jgi:hypothetical protein